MYVYIYILATQQEWQEWVSGHVCTIDSSKKLSFLWLQELVFFSVSPRGFNGLIYVKMWIIQKPPT